MINTMVDQLNAFARKCRGWRAKWARRAKLGGQAQVPGWRVPGRTLTDNVNSMATNLTNQVRGIANIVTAVAHGDLNHKLVFEAKGRNRGSR